MNEKSKNLLEELISQISSKEELELVREQLFKRGVENLLSAEMTVHLGHPKGKPPSGTNIRNGHSEKTLRTAQGNQRIRVPRDREASFDPVIVPKHKTMSQEIEDCIQLLYAKGMSNSDVVDFVERTYGVKYSTSQVSIITDALLEDIRQWQQRPLQDLYAVLWIDAIHYKIRHEGRVVSKACMITLGIDMEGRQDILGLSVVEKETAPEWMAILEDLRSRGIRDILFLCSDNLPGLCAAVEAIYPGSVHQICIVHQIRNSLKYVNYKDRRAIMADIKGIYKADNEKMAREAFEVFKANWNGKYQKAVNSWENNWAALTLFLEYPAEVRRLIYTTNIIESFNANLRKFTKNKKVFPTDDAAIKSIYLAARQISQKWKKTRMGWAQIYNQLYIAFPERLG